MTVRDERKIIRTMFMLRKTLDSTSIKRLKLKSGVDPNVSDNTITRVLKPNKYHYLQSRKKGLTSRYDARTRLLLIEK